jgi:pyruvyltransferase
MTRHKQAKVYYWNGRKNFGDALAPVLLEHFAGVKATRDTVSRANVVVTGSVLEHIPPEWSGHILGAGQLYEDSRLHLHTKTATVWALRGPLSARSVPGDYALGDPGLLADELVYVHHRDVGLGVVPHWSDTSLAKNPAWFGPGFTTRVIDVSGDPLDVIREIGRCQKIVTSSLHGLVIADAFGIPRRFEVNPHASKYEGGFHKFRDYSQSIRAPFEPGRLIEASRFYVEDRKHEIWDAFRGLGRALR